MNEKYGERIRSERHRLKMTQVEFARATGIAQASQVGYEKGDRLPNILYLERAAAFGVDVLYIVFGKRSKQVALDLVDWDTYCKILSAIDEWLEANPMNVDRDRTLWVARMLLHRYEPNDEIRPSDIAEYFSGLESRQEP